MCWPTSTRRSGSSPPFLLGFDQPAEVTVRPLDGTARYRAWLDNSFLLDIEDRDLLIQAFRMDASHIRRRADLWAGLCA